MTWLLENLPTILICLGLSAVVALIIARMVYDRKKGKHTCGGCAGCPMSGSCRKNRE